MSGDLPALLALLSLESDAFLGVGYRAEDFVVALENEELGAGESR